MFGGTCWLERTNVAVSQPSRTQDTLPHSKMPTRSVINQAWTQVDICNPSCFTRLVSATSQAWHLNPRRSWTMPTYVACSKIHHKYILHEYFTWGTYGQYSSNCEVSHPLLINNDDDNNNNNNKQALSVRKPVQMDKIPIVKK